MARQSAHTPTRLTLSYQLIRNTTSPDETVTGVRSYVANIPAFEILKIDTKQNLRSYIAEYSAQKRNRVHDAIRTTILQEPQRFITRNSGFVISASEIEVDDQKKVAHLTDPSILNGAQSQGEIGRWVEEVYGDDFASATNGGDEAPFYVRAEIIVDPDQDEVVETAIARNTATPVKSISQAGARGVLDDLEAIIKKRRPDIRIRTTETDDPEVYDTRKILQYTRLLMPASISKNETASEKLRAYKNPEQCLTDFSEWWKQRDADPEARRKYDFTVQIAPFAIEEYEYWERHEGWNGHKIWEETKQGGRACRRDKKNGKIVWISPGIVFPIMGAMSEFIEETASGGWTITKPGHFKPSEMIARTVAQFRANKSDPYQMGRNAGSYDALRTYPSTIMLVMRDLKDQQK